MKRKTKQESSSDDEESEEENLFVPNESIDEKDKIVDIDFEFFDPVPDDVYAVRNLLSQADGFWHSVVPYMSKAIAEQANVGTMIKCPNNNEDEKSSEKSDALGFVTTLNMKEHASSEFMKHLIKVFKKKQTGSKIIDKYFNSPKTGLLICERMVNLPLELLSPMWSAIVEDLAWARKEAYEPWRFDLDNLVVISRLQDSPVDVPQVSKHDNKKRKTDLEFTQPECSVLYKNSKENFQFSYKGRDLVDNHYVAMVISSDVLSRMPIECLSFLQTL